MATAKQVIVLVEWMDSVSLTGHAWHDRKELDSLGLSKCTTVGLLVRENEDCLVVAGSWGKDGDDYGGVIAIPKVAVIKRRKLK